MNIITRVYLQALGLYLVFSLPSIIVPYIYMLSAVYAFASSFIALFIFSLMFYLLHMVKAPAAVSITVFVTIIPFAVCAAYKALISVIMPGRDFWEMDGFTLFPMAAIIAGWVSIAINASRIKEHFAPTIIAEIETISVQS